MAGFSYIAIDLNGREKKGKMEAPNEERVFHTLKAEGFFPITIKELSLFQKDINITLGNPVKPRDLSVFSRQFMSILSAGVPIVKALDMLVEQTENKLLKKALKNTLVMVEKGEKLADSMRNQGRIFPPIFINMVEAGESSGSLEVALERMAVHFEKEAKIKAQVKKAMIYPSVVGFVSLAVIILMLVVVIPSFMKMFEDMNMEMPTMTVIALSMSNFMIQKWYLMVIMLTILFGSFLGVKNTYSGKLFLAKLALRLPIFGKIAIKGASARCSRTLSTLIAAGIPLIDSIDITARTMDNLIIKKILLESKEEVARGVPLSIPLKAAGVFPPMVHHMIRIGEETGNIETMLNKVADYYDEEVEVASQTLTTAMEPLIIIVLAIVVGLLIMAIMQPMFAMYDQLDTSLIE